MEVFLLYKERTRFIRQFYDTAAIPFETIKKAIEDGLPPFDNPPYSEDGEPAYLSEWIEASEALEILGRTCLSMLSASLQLYFKTWERKIGLRWEKGERKRVFKNGFLKGYMSSFETFLNISPKNCPADLELVAQIILARNRDQHPEEITTMRANYSGSDIERHGPLFFMSKEDSVMFNDPANQDILFLQPAVYVSRDQLLVAIEQTENLAGWYEKRLVEKRWGR